MSDLEPATQPPSAPRPAASPASPSSPPSPSPGPPPPPSTDRRTAMPTSGETVDARPGDLTPGWRAALAIGWLGVFFAYAAVWQASVQLGIATWWVGPRSTPAPSYIRAIPFFVAIVGLLLVVYNVRRLPRVTFWLAAATLLIALPDFSRSTGLAVLEVLISLSMMIMAAASLTGRYRLSDSSSGAPSGPLPPPPSEPPPPASGSVDAA